MALLAKWILAFCSVKEISTELLAQTREVLEMCDLAKFAKWKPEPLEVIKLNQMTEAIIKKASDKEAASSHAI